MFCFKPAVVSFFGYRQWWLPLASVYLSLFVAGLCHGQVQLEPSSKTPAVQPAVSQPTTAKQATPSVAVVQSRSVDVGEAFPDFELQDQDGATFSLHAALKKSPVVLVIYRSADW